MERIKHRDVLKVYVPWAGAGNSAIANYRMVHPLKHLERKGMVDFFFDRGSLDPSKYANQDLSSLRTKALTMSDLHVYHMMTDATILKMILSFDQKDRPTIIFSSDDNIEWIEPLNFVYPKLGTRMPDGTPLEPGCSIEYKTVTGRTITLKDGDKFPDGSTFSVENNIKMMGLHRLMAMEADGMCVTTPELAEVYKAYGAKNIYVYPNSIDFQFYPRVDINQKEIKLLWAGGASHWVDLVLILEPLKRVMERHPNVKLVFFGFQPFKHAGLPEERVERIDWVDPEAYPLRLSTIGHSINLCPLRWTPFNICKSAIKWYESSAISSPAATLASRVGPYQEIQDGETGYTFETTEEGIDEEEFEDKLGRLIEDAELRTRLATNAQDWVRENRDIEKNTPGLLEWWHQTIEKGGPRNYGEPSTASGPPLPGVEEAARELT